MTFQAPVAAVAPAAAQAAAMAGLKVKAQTPYSVKCKSGMTLTTYGVTIEVTVAGVDGAAVTTIYAHNFGMGPLQSGACRDRATRLVANLQQVLQVWSQQAPAQAAPPPSWSNS
jgi:hypothetical protein